MNNFDQSSSGVNLELNISYDNDLSQMWFNDNVVRLHGDNSFLYHGNISEDFVLNDYNNYDLKSSTRKEVYNHILEYFYSNSSEDFKEDSLTYFSKYSYQLTKIELIELVENTQECDYVDFLQRNFTPLYIVIESRDYSQGYYAEVVIPYSLWEGKAPTEEQVQYIQKEIDNLFWDAPIYARLTIDQDEEFIFEEFMKDVYNYDISEIIKIAMDQITHEKKQAIVDWLQINLPDQPSYK